MNKEVWHMYKIKYYSVTKKLGNPAICNIMHGIMLNEILREKTNRSHLYVESKKDSFILHLRNNEKNGGCQGLEGGKNRVM